MLKADLLFYSCTYDGTACVYATDNVLFLDLVGTSRQVFSAVWSQYIQIVFPLWMDDSDWVPDPGQVEYEIALKN